MAIVIEQTSESEGDKDTTFELNITGGAPTQDNLLIAFVGHADNTSITPDPADGWTELVEQTFGNGVLAIYWKIAGAAEPSTLYEFTGGGSERWAGILMEISGHLASNPIDDWAITTGSSATPMSPSVTVSLDGGLVISGTGFDVEPKNEYIDSGLSNDFVSDSHGAGDDVAVWGGSETIATAGASGTYTHGNDDTGAYAAFTVAVKINEDPTVISANKNSQIFTVLTPTVVANGVISAKKNSQLFTALSPTVLHPTTISANINSQIFTSYNIVRTFKPTINANKSVQKFTALKPSVDGFFVGQAIPGVWPDERTGTGHVDPTGE